MKRVKPNWLYRLKKGSKPAAKAFGATSGFAATVVGVASAYVVVPVSVLYGLLALCLCVSGSVLLAKSRSRHLPDIVIDDDDPDGKYQATFCDQAALETANRLTKPYYRNEYVTDQVAESWRKQNPQGFVAIENEQAELCAVFGVLALEPSFMTQFVKGRVLDTELQPDDILNFAGSKRSNRLYISGVVVRDPDSTGGHRRACVMVWAMLEYLRRVYGFRRRRTVYALAVSKQSRNLLKKTGFTVASPASGRKDQLDLYALDLSSQAAQKIAARIGDHSGSCAVRYEC